MGGHRGTVVGALVVGFMAVALFQKPAESEETPSPSALVTLAPVRSGPVGRMVEAYGVIAGSASATRTVPAPRDVIVQDVLTAPGLTVAAGAPVVQVGDTPASGLAYRQAADALAFAERDLTRVQRLYDQQLAANDQLAAARKTLADAQAAVAAQAAAGGGRARQIIASPMAGVVSQVVVQRGQQVAAGAPLLTVVAGGGFLAQFGVEPTQAARLAVGQPVRIVSVLDPDIVFQSRMSAVGRAVDPATRLIPAAAPVQGAGLALGAAVRGEITTATVQGLTVPSSSVVYDESGAHVFVVRGGKAHLVAVTVGPEQGDQVMVSGQLGANDMVAVSGAYQLEDGMAVRISCPRRSATGSARPELWRMTISERLARHRRSLLALLTDRLSSPANSFGPRPAGGPVPGHAPSRASPFPSKPATGPSTRWKPPSPARWNRPCAAVPGVTGLRSTTSRVRGRHQAFAFAWNSDMNLALQRTEGAPGRRVGQPAGRGEVRRPAHGLSTALSGGRLQPDLRPDRTGRPAPLRRSDPHPPADRDQRRGAGRFHRRRPWRIPGRGRPGSASRLRPDPG